MRGVSRWVEVRHAQPVHVQRHQVTTFRNLVVRVIILSPSHRSVVDDGSVIRANG
jgi:hypothetical protein